MSAWDGEKCEKITGEPEVFPPVELFIAFSVVIYCLCSYQFFLLSVFPTDYIYVLSCPFCTGFEHLLVKSDNSGFACKVFGKSSLKASSSSPVALRPSNTPSMNFAALSSPASFGFSVAGTETALHLSGVSASRWLSRSDKASFSYSSFEPFQRGAVHGYKDVRCVNRRRAYGLS